MKMKILSTCLFLTGIFCFNSINAQTDKGFSYQAVARDANGDLNPNAAVTVRFVIHQTTAGGAIVYDETHNTNTNDHGLFNLVVGDGTPSLGVFNNISWGSNDYFLQVYLNGVSMGTQEFQGVPYAKWAANGSKWVDGFGGDIFYSVGQVGIGTGIPNASLHIKQGGTSISDGIRLETSLLTTEDWYMYMDANDDLRFRNDAAEYFAIQKNTGNVGIGNFAFDAKFVVSGTSKFINGSEASLVSNGYLQLGTTTSLNLVMDDNEITARNNGAEATLYLQPNQGNVFIGTTGNLNAKLGINDADGTGYAFRVQSGGNTELLVWENGGVSVGTNNTTTVPANGLYVFGNVHLGGTGATGYRLAVDGKVMCEELRVQNSVDWPDYVFTNSYKLTSLSSLKKQIEDLGHLPGVPSAQQVEEEGIIVGNMQSILLEKVEELTLYLIESSERMDRLEAENAALRATVTNLKKR